MKALTFLSVALLLLFAGTAFASYGMDTSGTYVWADSNETWGPSYDWIDASPGTNLGTGDDTYFTTTTPFAISFYGISHAAGSNYYVGTNGMMSFNSEGMTSYSNTDLPNSGVPNDLIAVYWSDMRGIGTYGDHLYSYVSGSTPNRTWTLSYDPWEDYFITTNPLKFQVQIQENDGSYDNMIYLQYNDTTCGYANHGLYATAGIENSGGTQGHAYCYYDGNLYENLAVAYIGVGGLTANDFALLTPADGSTFLVPPKKDSAGMVKSDAEGKGSVDVTFTWENNGVAMDSEDYGMVQYELFIDDDPSFGSPDYDIADIVGVENPSQLVTITASADTTLYWRVIASNAYFDDLDVPCDADFSFNLDVGSNIQPSSLGKVKAIFE